MLYKKNTYASICNANVFFVLLLFSALDLIAEEKSDLYVPRIEGTIRAKYEYFSDLDEHRFQVRNARFSVRGNFSPITSYKAEIDLSDEGKTKMLDAYVRLQPNNNWIFTIGQQKVPFSTDNLRSPHELYFANRSFMGKQLTNLRDVGVSTSVSNEKVIPFDAIVAILNGLGLYTQDKSMKIHELSYGTRIVFFPKNKFQLSLNANTIHPSTIRMIYYNAGVAYSFGNFHLESEYLYKTYSENTLITSNFTTGFFVFGAYNIKTPKLQNISKITPVLRVDGMTRNLKYDIQSSTSIVTKIDEARTRLTGGVIISLAKPFLNDIRLNYERYFWNDGHLADNKFVAEFVVKF